MEGMSRCQRANGEASERCGCARAQMVDRHSTFLMGGMVNVGGGLFGDDVSRVCCSGL
jgi:hypothetical protein